MSEQELIKEMDRKVNKLHREGYSQFGICKELRALVHQHERERMGDILLKVQQHERERVISVLANEPGLPHKRIKELVEGMK